MLTPARARDIMTRIGDAMLKTRDEIHAYRRDHPEFDEVATSMLRQWDIGMQQALMQS
jgi:hypothetical protein